MNAPEKNPCRGQKTRLTGRTWAAKEQKRMVNLKSGGRRGEKTIGPHGIRRGAEKRPNGGQEQSKNEGPHRVKGTELKITVKGKREWQKSKHSSAGQMLGKNHSRGGSLTHRKRWMGEEGMTKVNREEQNQRKTPGTKPWAKAWEKAHKRSVVRGQKLWGGGKTKKTPGVKASKAYGRKGNTTRKKRGANDRGRRQCVELQKDTKKKGARQQNSQAKKGTKNPLLKCVMSCEDKVTATGQNALAKISRK